MAVPVRDPDLESELTAPYWEGFQEGTVRLPRCQDCGEFHWYPKRICPYCTADEIDWEDVSGRATLFTWVGVNYDFKMPFLEERVPINTALVTPEEDESIRLAAIVETPEDTEPEIGMELRASFHDEGSFPIPVYVPR